MLIISGNLPRQPQSHEHAQRESCERTLPRYHSRNVASDACNHQSQSQPKVLERGERTVEGSEDGECNNEIEDAKSHWAFGVG